MTERTGAEDVAVVNELGLHARAASRFVSTAKKFEADVRVRCGYREADGKSIVGLLTLAASKGRTLNITTRGDDSETALAALVSLVEAGFDEGVEDRG
jgi:phosphocarrier protein HPr